MSQADILGRLKDIISAVAGIGIVHDYERSSRSPAEWLDIMTSGGKINGWTISREATESEWEYHTTNRLRHIFKIKGYYAVDDANASEKTFQELVDLVRKAFNNNETLTGTSLRLIAEANGDEVATEALIELQQESSEISYNEDGDALISGPAQIDYVGIREIAPDSGYYVHVAELTLAADEREIR